MEKQERHWTDEKEFLTRLRRAGYDEQEIKEALEERQFAKELQDTVHPATPCELATLRILQDRENITTGERRVEVRYGEIPITFQVAVNHAGCDGFDPFTVDYEKIITAAHNHRHGRFYDSLLIHLFPDGTVMDAWQVTGERMVKFRLDALSSSLNREAKEACLSSHMLANPESPACQIMREP